MKYFIIAGEASGDLHASNLVKEIKKFDATPIFEGVGGDLMKAENVNLLFGLDRLAFMGFYEVLKNLRTIRRNFKEVKQAILHFKPDVIILIDYPGFNLRMAKWCKQNGFKVAYYIAPQIWAWKENRVEIIKKYVDLVLCILPFEKAFYDKHQYTNAHFVGHPLLDCNFEQNHELIEINKQKIVALLPGSRKQEINSLLPLMLETAQEFPNERFVITGITRLQDLYPTILPDNVSIVFDKTHQTLQYSKSAIVCSGTATLETALFNVPQMVIYKTSWLNYQIGKRLAKVKFISLPNLIADEKIVEEFIQNDCNAQQIKHELNKLLDLKTNQFYKILFEKIGQRGASAKAAQLIYSMIS
jgi:lipid-A-disaccharide synthase